MSTAPRLRRLVPVLAVLVTAVTVSACSNTPATDTGAPAALSGSGPATLWVRAADEPLDKALVAAWNTANPDRKITMLTVPDAQYVQKYVQAVRSGDTPDLAAVDIANVKSLTSQNLLTDITAQVNALPYKGELAPAGVDISTVDGKIYALPHQLDVSMLYYNKALFTKAGLDPAKPPTTLDELVNAARKITALGDGTYGFTMAGNCAGCNAYTLLPYIWASGGDIMNADGTKATLDSPAVAAALNAHKTMWDEKLMPPAAKDDNGATWLTGFQSGKVGMVALGSFGVSVYKADKNLDFGVTAIPGSQGTSAFLGGDVIGISKGAKNAQTAWDFIAWSMSADVQKTVVANTGQLTVRADAADNAATQAEPRLLVANKLIATAKVPVTAKYNSLFIDPTGPYLKFLRDWIFVGDTAKAISTGNDGFRSRLAS
ncbi:multiple sugar transport system substrate-binding protein [Allocatelliglobosispora scoriae]|uniref:Multiple sugar transport system substrate-binding protein n=1 Tax=Allocatelliglobosispora scoriae TaxID=643052 RepID=A0A841C3N1_9ACTN|nr:sugar ABC transporter substrate-binding protein [Allocatelliglobosispora scoriae]MBB5874526.1 multiple sugar transport system substrate-binding protein [Allocatelliglobosispora scoriae]